MIPKIPQNSQEYFQFIKRENFCSIDVQFNYFTKINYQNLFLIIKSYVNNDEILLTGVFILSSEIEKPEKNFDINIYHSVKIEKLKKMKFFEFKDWFTYIKENDYEYVKSLKYYGFRFVFSSLSLNWSRNEIYPIFPWKQEFKKIYIKREIDFEKWLYLKNKHLYNKWVLDKKNLK